jgi:hypothetical protein
MADSIHTNSGNQRIRESVKKLMADPNHREYLRQRQLAIKEQKREEEQILSESLELLQRLLTVQSANPTL